LLGHFEATIPALDPFNIRLNLIPIIAPGFTRIVCGPSSLLRGFFLQLVSTLRE